MKFMRWTELLWALIPIKISMKMFFFSDEFLDYMLLPACVYMPPLATCAYRLADSLSSWVRTPGPPSQLWLRRRQGPVMRRRTCRRS
jgi:hypothetical protein